MRKGSVHDANEAYVRQLRVPEDATEEEIQEALTRIFRQHTRDSGRTLKMSTTTGTQISDQFSVQDQSNNNVQDSKINSNQDQVDEDDDRQPVLAVFQKGFS